MGFHLYWTPCRMACRHHKTALHEEFGAKRYNSYPYEQDDQADCQRFISRAQHVLDFDIFLIAIFAHHSILLW
jgi:hypothetical protein